MTAAQERRYSDEGTSRSDDPEVIRAGISETRERISHDLDEIGDRLNPHNMKEDIKDGIREATIGRVEEMARNAGERLSGAGNGLVQTIRDNPLPAVIAGVGLAWLFMSHERTGRARPVGQPAETGTIDKAKERVTEIADQARETVSNAATSPVHGIQSTMEENPIALAAGALALGLAVGLLAPETRSEKRVMSDVGEGVVRKVSEVARDATEKAQHVAQRAVDEAKTAARDEGLTAGGGQQPGTP
jgi:uncharacterized protein (DUF2236 family)